MKIEFGPLLNAAGAKITGATVTARIRRKADDYLYDFDDSTFKASGWTDETGAMTEADSTNFPGSYELSVTITGWDDGDYAVMIDYAGPPAQSGLANFTVEDGEEAVPALITDVKFIRQFLSGRWKILSNQLIIYDADGSTALKTYDLKDADGDATMTSPYERVEAV